MDRIEIIGQYDSSSGAKAFRIKGADFHPGSVIRKWAEGNTKLPPTYSMAMPIDSRGWYLSVYFWHPDDAMLFKLTFK